MLPLVHYEAAHHNARFHVQLRIDDVADVARTPSFVEIRGVVVRVYRGEDALAEGDAIRLEVPVTRPGDELPCGGVIWKALDGLRRSSFMEAFVNGTPLECELALSQCQLIDARTDAPVMRGRFPNQVARKRWRDRFLCVA